MGIERPQKTHKRHSAGFCVSNFLTFPCIIVCLNFRQCVSFSSQPVQDQRGVHGKSTSAVHIWGYSGQAGQLRWHDRVLLIDEVLFTGYSSFREYKIWSDPICFSTDDELLTSGAKLEKLIVAHPALEFPVEVQITYTAYQGWIYSGQ